MNTVYLISWQSYGEHQIVAGEEAMLKVMKKEAASYGTDFGVYQNEDMEYFIGLDENDSDDSPVTAIKYLVFNEEDIEDTN